MCGQSTKCCNKQGERHLMSDSKDLMLRLVAACERFWLEKQALKSLLISAKVPGWEKMFERLIADEEIAETAHQHFRPVYERVEREADADKAIQELIRVLPKSQRPN
jgi:hypothetical protein